jgi:interleukin-1 receptor-associated kinase 1
MWRRIKSTLHNKITISHKACFVNRHVPLQVRAHYITHEDILGGLVNLVKKLKIKRIIIGSR